MKVWIKRQLSLFLAVIMAVTFMPLAAIADERDGDLGRSGEPPLGLSTVFTVRVNYFFAEIEGSTVSGEQAAQPYVANLLSGEEYKATSPTIKGFEPDQTLVEGTVTDEDINIDVFYSPSGDVTYTVEHWFEKLDGEYEKDSKVDSLKGKTADKTVAEARTVIGFEAEQFEQVGIASDGSTKVRIDYKRTVNTVYFHTNGGSYIDPVEAKFQQTVSGFVTTQEGYKFEGWYKNPDFSGEKVTSVKMETEDVELYAKWSGDKAAYTVIYWQEKADSEGYDFKEQEKTAKGTVGQTIYIGNDAMNKKYDGFELADYDKNVVIKADGTSILNVYFNRKTYTLSFYNKNSSVLLTSITAKYGSYILDKWQSNAQINGYNWSEIKSAKGPWTASLEIMPYRDISFYKSTGEYDLSIYYCLEILDQNSSKYDKIYNGKKYEYRNSKPVKFKADDGTYLTEAEDCYPINGFTYTGSHENFEWEYFFGFLTGKKTDAYIYYKRNKNTITFNSMGGTPNPESITALYESEVTAPATRPSKPGYEFAGWYNNEACEGEAYKFTTMPFVDTLLYAKYVPKIYDVKFDLNYTGATGTPADQKIDYLAKVEEPTAPTRDGGYTFAGWYTNAEGTGTRYNFDRPVSESFTLYAKWTTSKTTSYTVKYLKEDSSDFSPQKDVSGKKVGETVTEEAVIKSNEKFVPDAVSKSLTLDHDSSKNVITFIYKPFTELAYRVRYIDKATNEELLPTEDFDKVEKAAVTVSYKPVPGYYPDRYQKTQTLVLEETIAEIDQNVITFYYTKAAVSDNYYTEIHHVQNDAGEYEEKYNQQIPAAVGSKVNAKNTPYEGHYVNSSKSNITGLVSSDNGLVLNVYYDWNKYTLTYTNGTDNDTNSGIRYNSDETVKGNMFAVPQYKQFSYWIDKEDNDKIYNPQDTINIKSNKTLTAVFAFMDKIDVTYLSGDGTGTMDGHKVYPGEKFTVKENEFTAPTDKKFSHWLDSNGITRNPSDEVSFTKNTTLTAVWIDVEKYTITYFGNGGTKAGGEVSYTSDPIVEKTEISIDANTFENAGYDFTGWNTSADGTGTSYTEIQKINIADDMTLYAQWNKDASKWAKLYYDGNGNTGGTAPVDAYEYIIGITEVTILGNTGNLTRTKAVFLGWSFTQEDLITTQAEEDAAGIISSKFTLSGDATVYAVWAKDDDGDGTPDYKQFAVTYDANGGTGTVPADPNFYDAGEKATLKEASTLSKADSMFIGWTTTAVSQITTIEEQNAVNPLLQPANEYEINANTTFYAVWADDTNGDGTPDYLNLRVIYKAGEGVGADHTDSGLYKAGSPFTVLGNDVTGFTRTDYMFTGWKNQNGTEADGGDTAQFEADATENIIFTAQWTLDKNGPDEEPDGIPDDIEYSVIYNANGGVNPPVDNAIYPKAYEVSVKFDAPTLDGFVFKGWAYKADAEAPDFTATGIKTLTMGEKDITLYAVWEIGGITAQDVEVTYDGQNHFISLSGTMNDDEIEYTYDGSSKDTNFEFKNVGTYLVDAKVTRMINRREYSVNVSAQVKINPRELTAAFIDERIFLGDVPSYNYDFETATATTGFVSGESVIDLPVALVAGSDYDTMHIAGIYDMKLTSGLGINGNYDVKNITAKLTVIDPQSLFSVEGGSKTYDGTPIKATVNGQSDDFVVFFTADEVNYTDEIPQRTDVGEDTYHVYVMDNQTEGRYKISSPDGIKLTVLPRPLKVTADSFAVLEGEAVPTYTYKFADATDSSGFATGENESNLATIMALSSTYTTTSAVGEYPITFTAGSGANGNYMVEVVPGKVDVFDGNEVFAVNSYKGVYDAADHGIILAGIKDGDTVEYSTDNGATFQTSAPTRKDVGVTNVIVRVVRPGVQGYSQKSTTIEVTPAPLTVTAKSYSITTSQSIPTFDADITGFVGNENASVVSGTISYDCSYTSGGATGTYPITPKGIKAHNYNISYVAGTLNVTTTSSSGGGSTTDRDRDDSGSDVQDTDRRTSSTVNIDDGDVPLSDNPLNDGSDGGDGSLVNIPDQRVPLAGGLPIEALGIGGFAAIALGVFLRIRKRKDQE